MFLGYAHCSRSHEFYVGGCFKRRQQVVGNIEFHIHKDD